MKWRVKKNFLSIFFSWRKKSRSVDFSNNITDYAKWAFLVCRIERERELVDTLIHTFFSEPLKNKHKYLPDFWEEGQRSARMAICCLSPMKIHSHWIFTGRIWFMGNFCFFLFEGEFGTLNGVSILKLVGDNLSSIGYLFLRR